MGADQVTEWADNAWAQFRSWPTWLQVLCWLVGWWVLIPIAAWQTDWSVPLKSGVSIAAILSLVLLAATSGSSPPTETASELADGSPTPRPTATPASPSPTPSPTADPDDGRSDPPAPLANGTGGITGAPTAEEGLSLLDQLAKSSEGPRSGYDRDLFNHWIDSDGDSCDTREEVLIEESRTEATTGSGCRVTGGEWLSAYDGTVFTNSSDLDVDHMVPLAEAWDSGADTWSSSRREAFANDLDYSGSLIAVSASSNRSKSDRDPADWKPDRTSYWCTYAATWARVKIRWDLTADQREVDGLRGMLDTCAGSEPEAPAPAPAETPTPTEAPPPPPDPTPAPTEPPQNCHPSYPDFCIPPPPPDLNCDDMERKNFTVRHDVQDPDPHGFDRDKDGVGCES